MKKRFRKLLSAISVLVLTVAMLPVYGTDVKAATVSGHVLKNPVKESSNTEWDCVWFGSYPQAEVIPSSTYTALSSRLLLEGDIIVSDEIYNKLIRAKDFDWNENGDIRLDGEYYRRIKKSDATLVTAMAGQVTAPLGDSLETYQWDSDSEYHYFKYEPIKWRVLDVTENDVLLLADKGLDDPSESCDIDYWENSGIRSWLNGDSSKNFIKAAFSTPERSIIKTTERTEGTTTVSDNVFLLSESDVSVASYGFNNDNTSYDSARLSRSSTFAKAMGTVTDTDTISALYGYSPWLLSSVYYSPANRGGPGHFMQYCVTKGTVIAPINSWLKMCVGRCAVRPALHIDLSSSSKVCTYAGTVNSNGK